MWRLPSARPKSNSGRARPCDVAPESDFWPIGQISGYSVGNGRVGNARNNHHREQQTNKDPTLRHSHPCAVLKAEIQ